MKSKAFFLFGIFFAMASSALAAPECTKEPKEKWKNQEAFKKELSNDYDIKVFKVAGNCYEIYGWRKSDKKKVEIYFNPVTGEKVKEEVAD